GKKIGVIIWVLRDEDDTHHRCRCILMDLKGRVPEVFRIVMQVCEKPDLRRARIARKDESEGEPDLRSVRTPGLAPEFVRCKIPDPGCMKPVGVARAIAIQHEHR